MFRAGRWSGFLVPVCLAVALLDADVPFPPTIEARGSQHRLQCLAGATDGTPDQKPRPARSAPPPGNHSNMETSGREPLVAENLLIQKLKADAETLHSDLRSVPTGFGPRAARDINVRIDRLTVELEAEIQDIKGRLARLSTHQAENQEQLDQIQDRLIWLCAITGTLAFIAAGGALGSLRRHRRRKQAERRVPGNGTEEGSPRHRGQTQLFPEPRKDPARASESPLLNVLRREAASGSPKDPPLLLAELARAARLHNGLQKAVRRPQCRWGLACRTVRGHVRAKNEDYALAFEVENAQLLVLADGCGGTGHGQRASYLSSLAAGISLIQSLAPGRSITYAMRERLVEKAFHFAWRVLRSTGTRLGVREVRDGLRTTLVVVVGLPVFGSTPRRPGDLLLAGTDGVFDYVPASSPKDVMRAVINAEGHLDLVLEQVLTELADARDSGGYICEDNLTLGLMMGRERPVLGPGYWSDALSAVAPKPIPPPEALQ